jgi:glycerol-3-phosphate dehydrogenase subunit B
MRSDVIVVGAGPSGLAAAVALAEAGRGVRVIAGGNGFTHWGTGAFDVLASSGGQPVERPLDGLARLPERHPYRLLGEDALRRAVDAFQRLTGGAGLAYEGSLDANRRQVTALGTMRPTCLLPETAARPLAGRVVVVGFEGFRDFSASLCARGLSEAGHEVTARTVQLPAWDHERYFTSVELARAIDGEDFRARLADRIGPATRGADVAVLPAVLGVASGHAAWADLERRLGVQIVEAALVPPSIPGLRLWAAWLARLRELGVRVQLGFPATGLQTDQGNGRGRVSAVATEGAARTIVYRCAEVVLATGGVAGRGIVAGRDGSLVEEVAGLPVRGFGHRMEYFGERFLDDHPLGLAGVVVDDQLRPLDEAGDVAIDGVRCVGGLLAGHDPTVEGSREGVAMTTATRAAELLSPSPV